MADERKIHVEARLGGRFKEQTDCGLPVNDETIAQTDREGLATVSCRSRCGRLARGLLFVMERHDITALTTRHGSGLQETVPLVIWTQTEHSHATIGVDADHPFTLAGLAEVAKIVEAARETLIARAEIASRT